MKTFKQTLIFSGLFRLFFLILFVLNISFLIAQSLPQPTELIPYRKGDKWGFCDRNKKIVINCIFNEVNFFNEEGFAMVQKEDKYGVIDRRGKEILPAEYDEIWFWNDDYITVVRNGKTGFADKSGKIVIPLVYENAQFFSEGLAAVQLKGKWGYIDRKGKTAIPFKFDLAESFNKGIAKIMVNDQYNYIDKKGNFLIKDGSVLISDAVISDEYIIFYTGEDSYFDRKVGLMDRKGKIILPPEYESIYNISNGRIIFNKDGMVGMANLKGTVVLEPKYLFEGFSFEDLIFSDGMMKVWDGEKYGYIDTNGNEIVTPQFDEAMHFSDGLAAVKKDDKWGFIDLSGKLAIPFRFDEVRNFSNGLAVFQQEDKYGVIDKTGKEIIKPVYDIILMNNQLILAKKDDLWGILSLKGVVVQNFKFDLIKIFDDGYIAVREDGKWGVAGRDGNLIINPEYDELEKTGTGEDDFDMGIYAEIKLFNDPIIAFRQGELWGFIHQNGNVIIQPKYEYTEGFNNGMALVSFNGKTGYIDSQGIEYWED